MRWLSLSLQRTLLHCHRLNDPGSEVRCYTLNDKKREVRKTNFSFRYPEPGSNRHGHYWPQDFKSGVSTDSTIRASMLE